MDNIIITFNDGTKKEYYKGIKFGDVVRDAIPNKEIVCGSINNTIVNNNDAINHSGKLLFYGLDSSMGSKVYERGLIFLFRICAIEVLGNEIELKIRNSIDRGVFFEIDRDISEGDVQKIKDLMHDKVKKDLTFEKVETSMNEAIAYFKQRKREDKIKTLFYDKNKYVTLYKFDGVYNYFIGDLPHSSSILKYFDLTLILGKGIILRYPSMYDKGKMVKYTHHAQFFDSISLYLAWSKILKMSSIGELNDEIVKNKPGDIVNTCEFIQDNRLQFIAKNIWENRDKIKMVLLSGPSSSGKTTTAKKLSMYLKTAGLNPVAISLDDYFLERDETPLNENGKPDYESLRAIDVKLFDKQMAKLLKGNRTTLPTFNFLTGKKEYNRTVEMHENDILLIEGLHALSADLLSDIPSSKKYRIYVSPLVFINVDDDNRINLTDVRLIRRMVRDNRTRGYTPSQTLANWSEVREGEEKYVFPYQDSADIICNTFAPYELSVMKVYALPLLYTVQPDDPEYLTALRLIKLFDLVLPLPSDEVPSLSILREFIGKGYFE